MIVAANNIDPFDCPDLSDDERRRIVGRVWIGAGIAAVAALALVVALVSYLIRRPDTAVAATCLALAIIGADVTIMWAQRCSERRDHYQLNQQHLALITAARQIQTSIDADRIQQQRRVDELLGGIEAALLDLAAKVADREREAKISHARQLIADARGEGDTTPDLPQPPDLYSLGSPTPSGGIRVDPRWRRQRGRGERED